MPKLIMENPVFEITDYTTASNWERFTALIEEILTQWGLNKNSKQRDLRKGDMCGGVWLEKREFLRYGDSTYDVRLLYLQIEDQFVTESDNEAKQPDLGEKEREGKSCCVRRDPSRLKTRDNEDEDMQINDSRPFETLPECLRDLMSSENDFASKAPCLNRWYGLRQLLILSPKGDTIISENRVKLILSSASIALSSINCEIPFFVQIHNPKNNFFQGVSEHANIRTVYEMVWQNKSIQQYSYLSELISLFREKISANFNDSISVAVKFVYNIEEFEALQIPVQENEFCEYQKELQHLMPKKNDSTDRSASSPGFYGPNSTFEEVVEAMKTCNPLHRSILRSFQLGTAWNERSDKVIIDSHVHSDLDPSEAPIWSLRSVARHCGPLSLVYHTFILSKLFNYAIEYSYIALNGKEQFSDTTPDALKRECLELSYKLSKEPEVFVSNSQTDNIRKLVAVIFHLTHSHNQESEGGFEQVIKSLKRNSLNEMYHTFKDTQQPWIKEYILRTQVSRPFIPAISPALPQRMFCTISSNELRLCGAFSELCN